MGSGAGSCCGRRGHGNRLRRSVAPVRGGAAVPLCPGPAAGLGANALSPGLPPRCHSGDSATVAHARRRAASGRRCRGTAGRAGRREPFRGRRSVGERRRRTARPRRRRPEEGPCGPEGPVRPGALLCYPPRDCGGRGARARGVAGRGREPRRGRGRQRPSGGARGRRGGAGRPFAPYAGPRTGARPHPVQGPA